MEVDTLGYRPALDGIRGLAVLAVMAHHAHYPWARGGHVGVDVFFVVSGFLITALLLREWDGNERIDLRRFYIRRALRLAPALCLLVIAYLGYVVVFPPTRFEWWEPAFHSMLFTANWVRAFADHSVLGPLNHTWSLAIEEQFYLTWPIVLCVLLKRGIRPRKLLLALCAAIATAAVWRLYLFRLDPTDIARVYNGLDTRADALLVGCFLGVAWKSGCVPQWVCGHTCTTAALGVLALAVWNAPTVFPALYLGGYTLISGAAGLVILRSVASPFRVLQARPLVVIGRISYGLYLWHFPLRVILERHQAPWLEMTYWGGSFALAVLSFYLVESPFLKLKKRFAVGSETPGVASRNAAGRSPAGPLLDPATAGSLNA